MFKKKWIDSQTIRCNHKKKRNYHTNVLFWT
jgi:hypothetical protein